MQQNIHPCIVELKMTADREGREAATAYRPKAEKGHEQPVAILDLALLDRLLIGSANALCP